MYEDKQRHEILQSFTNIYTKLLEEYDKSKPKFSIDETDPITLKELMDNCSLKMEEDTFKSRLAYFHVTGYVENTVDIIDSDYNILSKITPKGIEAFTGQYFLEKYNKDSDASDLQNSVLKTNKILRFTGWSTFVFTLAIVILSICQYFKKDQSAVQLQTIGTELESPIITTHKIDTVFLLNLRSSSYPRRRK